MSDNATIVYLPAHGDVAYLLRTVGKEIEQEAALAEAKAKHPERFTDETLVAVLELAWRLGWRSHGEDPRRWLWNREDAAAWLRRCIDQGHETEQERLMVAAAEVLLAELGRST